MKIHMRVEGARFDQALCKQTVMVLDPYTTGSEDEVTCLNCWKKLIKKGKVKIDE